MHLIAWALTGKGSWTKVYSLMGREDIEKVTVITNEYGKERFNPDKKTKVFSVDTNEGVRDLVEDLKKILREETSNDLEVALNIDSGEGREHAALIWALVELGMGMRFFVVEGSEVIEL